MDADADRLSVRLLGDVRATLNRTEVGLGTTGPRSLFAVLALHSNTIVSRGELIEALWGEHPPKSADGNIYSYVSNLRKALEKGQGRDSEGRALDRIRGGYQLTLSPNSLDLAQFEDAGRQARSSAAASDFAGTLRHCDIALALWTGTALNGTAGPLIENERERLALRKLDLQELRCAALIETGAAATAVLELSSLVTEHQLNERLHELLMLALYRSGRQADALLTYLQLRDRVVNELGIEPGTAIRELQQAILKGEPRLLKVSVTQPQQHRMTPLTQTSPRIGVKPAQLPHRVSRLAGRNAEINHLRSVCELAINDQSGGNVVIVTIDGIAGVGKTALTLHVAHQLTSQFPDGQLFIDLHGFNPQSPAMAPEEALGHLLRGLSGSEEATVTDVDEQAALYRSLLAGKRVLVVLDNAASAEQVRPLLPGSPGCIAMITSRGRLAGLVSRDGATRLALDGLTPEGSLELLRDVLGDDLVSNELTSARELADRCGHLPLALRIAAERIAGGDYFELSEMVHELREEQNRLDALATPDDPLSTVRAVFSWSYHGLKPEDARAFRLLSLHPGEEVTPQVAAVLFGTDLPTAKRHIASLDRRNLLQRVGSDRYRSHDLLRIYAAECARLDEPKTALDTAQIQLQQWYLASVITARKTLIPEFAPVKDEYTSTLHPPIRLDSYGATVKWANDELTTIEALLKRTLERGDFSVTTALATMASALYFCTSRWAEWQHAIEIGRTAAERLGDIRSLAFLRNDAATALRDLGQLDEAVATYAEAIELLKSVPDQSDPAVVDNLAMAYSTMAMYTDSAALWEQSWKAVESHPTKLSEATLASRYCYVLSQQNKHVEAREYGYRSIKLLRNADSPYMLAQGLLTVGEACMRAGWFEEAEQIYAEALDVWRGLSDREREAYCLHAIARARVRSGSTEDASELLDTALELLHELGTTKARAREISLINDLLVEIAD